MSWSRVEVSTLLEEYRKWPNLYKIKSVNYKNRNLRQKAQDAILIVIKQMKPNITIQDIQAKFQALKQNAVKEYRKWCESKKSGAGLDEIVEPSLWYFKIISFIFDDATPREAFDSLRSTEITLQENNGTEEFENSPSDSQFELLVIENDNSQNAEEMLIGQLSSPGVVEDESPLTPTSSHEASQLTSNWEHSSKRKPKGKKDDEMMNTLSAALRNISNACSTPTVTHVAEECTQHSNRSFGEHVSSKLQKIDIDEFRDEAEEQIVSALNIAVKKCRAATKK